MSLGSWILLGLVGGGGAAHAWYTFLLPSHLPLKMKKNEEKEKVTSPGEEQAEIPFHLQSGNPVIKLY